MHRLTTPGPSAPLVRSTPGFSDEGHAVQRRHLSGDSFNLRRRIPIGGCREAQKLPLGIYTAGGAGLYVRRCTAGGRLILKRSAAPELRQPCRGRLRSTASEIDERQ